MKTNGLRIPSIWAICTAVFTLTPVVATAGGLLGDAINLIAPGAGTQLDDAHRRIKEAIPPYKAIEEGASKTVNEALVQTNAPILQQLIASSRDDALQNGVQPIPSDIRQNLVGFVSEHILNIARYRVRGGGDLSLQVNAIRYGEAQAITLDYVIVFKDENDALYNPTLWAHELTHIEQFQRWGIRDFSIRYLRSHPSVENEAYQAETRYLAWVSVKNTQQWASTGNSANFAAANRPIAPFSNGANSSTCSTTMGMCRVNGVAPVGTSCWCNHPVMGAAAGALTPDLSPPGIPSSSSGLPPGYGMQVCGCWGPNPSPVAPESRCSSGNVRLNVCPGFCAPGHPRYAYVCQ